mmetsp:Transcript_25594/g.59605  ORF Transcript_25594/g.59605 Transcript_25594/m.59605 type:complete len:725 (-) Transcript_25594:67-2241(-)
MGLGRQNLLKEVAPSGVAHRHINHTFRFVRQDNRPQVVSECQHIESLAASLHHVHVLREALHRRDDGGHAAAVRDEGPAGLVRGHVHQNGAAACLQVAAATELPHRLQDRRDAGALGELHLSSLFESDVPQHIHGPLQRLRVLTCQVLPYHLQEAGDAAGRNHRGSLLDVVEGERLHRLAGLGALCSVGELLLQALDELGNAFWRHLAHHWWHGWFQGGFDGWSCGSWSCSCCGYGRFLGRRELALQVRNRCVASFELLPQVVQLLLHRLRFLSLSLRVASLCDQLLFLGSHRLDRLLRGRLGFHLGFLGLIEVRPQLVHLLPARGVAAQRLQLIPALQHQLVQLRDLLLRSRGPLLLRPQLRLHLPQLALQSRLLGVVARRVAGGAGSLALGAEAGHRGRSRRRAVRRVGQLRGAGTSVRRCLACSDGGLLWCGRSWLGLSACCRWRFRRHLCGVGALLGFRVWVRLLGHLWRLLGGLLLLCGCSCLLFWHCGWERAGAGWGNFRLLCAAGLCGWLPESSWRVGVHRPGRVGVHGPWREWIDRLCETLRRKGVDGRCRCGILPLLTLTCGGRGSSVDVSGCGGRPRHASKGPAHHHGSALGRGRLPVPEAACEDVGRGAQGICRALRLSRRSAASLRWTAAAVLLLLLLFLLLGCGGGSLWGRRWRIDLLFEMLLASLSPPLLLCVVVHGALSVTQVGLRRFGLALISSTTASPEKPHLQGLQ